MRYNTALARSIYVFENTPDHESYSNGSDVCSPVDAEIISKPSILDKVRLRLSLTGSKIQALYTEWIKKATLCNRNTCLCRRV